MEFICLPTLYGDLAIFKKSDFFMFEGNWVFFIFLNDEKKLIALASVEIDNRIFPYRWALMGFMMKLVIHLLKVGVNADNHTESNG